VEAAEIKRVAGAPEMKKPAFGRRVVETRFRIHPVYQKLSFCQGLWHKNLIGGGANRNGSQAGMKMKEALWRAPRIETLDCRCYLAKAAAA
jgi:hypothetical protein